MKFVLLIVVLVVLAGFILVSGLTRDAHRARIERQRNRDALAGAQIALHQIQAFSEDDYATNLAKVALDDMANTLDPKRVKGLTN